MRSRWKSTFKLSNNFSTKNYTAVGCQKHFLFISHVQLSLYSDTGRSMPRINYIEWNLNINASPSRKFIHFVLIFDCVIKCIYQRIRYLELVRGRPKIITHQYCKLVRGLCRESVSNTSRHSSIEDPIAVSLNRQPNSTQSQQGQSKNTAD